MENLINIIEKLKVGSKTKVSTEIETIDDFCKKYNCEFYKDQKHGDMEFNYLEHNNEKINNQFKKLLNITSQAWRDLQNDIQKLIKDDVYGKNYHNYKINVRRNEISKLIVIGCENRDDNHCLCTITIANNNKISEMVDTKHDFNFVQKIMFKIIDYILDK